MLEPTSHILDRWPIGDGAMSASAVAGWIGLIWYLVVLVVCALGYSQMYVLSSFLEYAILSVWENEFPRWGRQT